MLDTDEMGLLYKPFLPYLTPWQGKSDGRFKANQSVRPTAAECR